MDHLRLAERSELRSLLEGGSSILMLAPRRIGKTWLLKKIDEDMTEAGWLCIRVDVEGKRTEDEFLRELCGAIEKKQDLGKRLFAHISQRFRQATTDAKGGNLHDIVGKIDSPTFLETLVESLDAEPMPTLILVDEIALFVLERAREDAASVTALLYHLRKLQQAYPNVRWFLTGSVGLDVVARRHGISGALLDYDSFELEAFEAAAARSYVDHLCGSKQVTHPFACDDNSFDQIVRELGWLAPYYLRQLSLLVRASGPPAPGSNLPTATRADISAAAEALLAPRRRMHFAKWEEHIVKNFEPAETDRLRAILDIAANDPSGEMEPTYTARLHQGGRNLGQADLREALNNLGNDGFLVKRNGRWRFQSELLRRYWREYMAQ